MSNPILQELGLGQARMRTLINGKPTDTTRLLSNYGADLATGYFDGNIRNTAATLQRRQTASFGMAMAGHIILRQC